MSCVLELSAPSFLYRDGSGVAQPVLLRALRPVDAATVTIGGSSHAIEPLAAGAVRRIPVPRATRAGQTVAVVIDVDGTRRESILELPLVRELTLHIFHHAHQDSGWADRPSVIRERMIDYLDAAIAEVERTRQHPAAARFRWNVESSFLVEDWLTVAGEARRQAFLRAVRTGSIEIGALFAGLHTDLASLEELCQVAAYAHRLRTAYRLPIRSAFLNDVPGLAWSLPTVLAASGVDQLVWGPDPIRSLTHRSSRPPLYRYEGRDGAAVLTWQSPYAYIEAWPLAAAPIAEWDELVDRLLKPYLALDCPSAHALLHTAHDFNAPSRTLSDAVAAWNERWLSPSITLSTATEFFAAVREEGAPAPTFRGPSPDPWTDGIGSLAGATGRKRRAERRLVDAVAYSALTQRLDIPLKTWQSRIAEMFPPTAMQLAKRPWFDYPQRDIDAAFAALLMVDEHTFGSVEASRPNRGLGRSHWLEKERHYDDLVRLAEVLELEGSERLAREVAIRHEPSIIVLNPTSSSRSGTIELAVPAAWGPVSLREGDRAVPTELIGNHEDTALLRAHVSSIPGHGYRRYSVEPAGDPASPVHEIGATRIESAAFVLTLDDSGVVSSLVDRRHGHELVDGAAEYRLGQFVLIEREDIPASIPDDFDDSTLTGQQVWEVAADLGRYMRECRRTLPVLERTHRVTSDLLDVLVAEHRLPGYGSLVTEYSLDQNEAVLDVRVTLEKDVSLPREAAYICFPFDLADARTTIDGPGYVFAPSEQMAGSSYDHVAVHEWVACAGRQATIVLAPLEAPLVSLGGMHHDRWLTSPTGPQAHLYSYVLNSSWWTNFPLTQYGNLIFSYRLTTLATGAPADIVAATGAGLAHDLLAVAVDRDHGYNTLPGEGTFVHIEPLAVHATALHAIGATEGADLLLRVLERSGEPQMARISFPLGRGFVASATKTSMFGDSGKPLEVSEGVVRVPLAGYELASIRVSFERPVNQAE